MHMVLAPVTVVVSSVALLRVQACYYLIVWLLPIHHSCPVVNSKWGSKASLGFFCCCSLFCFGLSFSLLPVAVADAVASTNVIVATIIIVFMMDSSADVQIDVQLWSWT